MTQKEMARLVNRSPVTIQKIELLKLPLAESLGAEIAFRTGVSLEWLMKNDTSAPILGDDLKPYTREVFELCQSRKPNDPHLLFHAYFNVPAIIAMSVMNVARGALAAQAANEVGAVELFGYRITKASGDIIEHMHGFEDLFEKWGERLNAAMRSEDSGNDCYRLIAQVLQDCSHASNKIMESKIGRPLTPPPTKPPRSKPAQSPRKPRRA
jgi:hypothetical protein